MKQFIPLSILAVCAAGCASAPQEFAGPPPMPVLPTTQQATITPSSDYVTSGPQNPSLWATTPTSLLSFGRAKDVGDLLTVIVEMDDQASLQNSLSRTRNSSENLELQALFGLPEWAATVLPGGATLAPAVEIDRDSDLQGSGSINRAERVAFRLASRVVGVEPNGNLIIQGYQQTRISNEVRYLTVSGVIRVQDITRTNTIDYDKIADAQISYISSGVATGPTNRKLLPKVLDTVVPF